MATSHQFTVAPRDWPTDTPAKRVTLTVSTPSGEKHTYHLTAGECRRLVRTALTGLSFTKTVRAWHGKQAGWEKRVDDKVQPVMKMIEGMFPKEPGVKKSA